MRASPSPSVAFQSGSSKLDPGGSSLGPDQQNVGARVLQRGKSGQKGAEGWK